MIRIADRGTRYVPVKEDLWVGDDGDAWLASLQPLDAEERNELGTFRTTLDESLRGEAQRLEATLNALGADEPAGHGDLAVSVGSDAPERTFFVPSVAAAPEIADQAGWAADVARWHARVRPRARLEPWSTVALSASASTASDGTAVRFALAAGGPRTTRVLVDRSTFALVGDDGAARYVGQPEPDALWDATGSPLDSLLIDFALAPGESGSVAFFAVPGDALPARGSLHLTLAVITTEPEDALPYPAEPVELRTPLVAIPGG
jgi:hypothetical protein